MLLEVYTVHGWLHSVTHATTPLPVPCQDSTILMQPLLCALSNMSPDRLEAPVTPTNNTVLGYFPDPILLGRVGKPGCILFF